MIGLFARRSGLRAVLVGLVYALLLGSLKASAGESLARLVPDSAGLCIELRDLAGSLARAQHGELAKRAEANPVVRAKLAIEVKRASGLRTALVAQLGISADEASRLFSDQLVLAVWAGKLPGESGPGLLILRCPDQPLLARVGRNVAARQRAAGRLDPARPFAAHGQTVEVHTINTGHSDRAGAQVCLAIVGDLAIVATHRELLEETITAAWDEPAVGPLANLPAYRAA
ncbi:MAG TPA: hypothetical protein VHY20_06590, partial [Pirellulales bacterium]|nr:hypothetical protein [Pirellulales bacterium]